ncbi:uncharacterized protein [Spinacia oleracea]|uniref:PB1-like domain-containing protein n=1 Tax=Spinacia oleracea TaxID=3562 RepID=A0ABM3RP49_SPIOL|nr:uncharacterized protein LOC110776515 [Spinacia oleracea]
MEPVTIRLFHGGQFVSRNNKTTYERGDNPKAGMSLHTNVEEICYFEFADWIRRELGYEKVGQIWFRRRGCSLHGNGRKEIKSDVEIPDFLSAPEKDGSYQLYVVHGEKEYDDRSHFPTHVKWYSDSDFQSSGGGSNSVSGDSSMGGPLVDLVSSTVSSTSQNPNSSQHSTHCHTFKSLPPHTNQSKSLPPSNLSREIPPPSTIPLHSTPRFLKFSPLLEQAVRQKIPTVSLFKRTLAEKEALLKHKSAGGEGRVSVSEGGAFGSES